MAKMGATQSGLRRGTGLYRGWDNNGASPEFDVAEEEAGGEEGGGGGIVFGLMSHVMSAP
jgi:hypothetical protein